jgi:hypothetical protein
MPDAPADHRQLWKTLSRALGAEIRERPSIRGASGLEHPVHALSVDDKHQRIIVISAESNPRTAALIQGDIQATMPDVSVLVARPIIVDLGVMVRRIFPSAATAFLEPSVVSSFGERLKTMSEQEKSDLMSGGLMKAAGPMLTALKKAPLPGLTQLVGIFQQASVLDWQEIFDRLSAGGKAEAISFSKLYELDNLAVDRAYGVCSLPLYEFTDADWDMFLSTPPIDLVQNRLKQLDIWQYFFPPADQLALGLTERGIHKKSEITELVATAPAVGHPLGASELVPTATQITDLIDVLHEQGYVAEVEQHIEITPSGTSARMTIKSRPRESLISKIINRFTMNVSVSAKDFLPPP